MTREYASSVRAEMRVEILRLCRGKFLSVADLAIKLEKSVNTVRAHYVYPLVKDGLLEPKYETRRPGQAYRTVKR